VAGAGFEAIILAGGLGTRIRSVVADLPKVMVDIGGCPFLEILLARISQGGIQRTILATGHLHALIQARFGNRRGAMEIVYSVEDKPLGTGGAVWKALQLASRNDVFVFNGDTFFDIDLREFHQFHQAMGADVSLALKPMRDFDRYGTVEVTGGRISGFLEKRPTANGLINGGVYLMNRRSLERLVMPEKFSLETEFFQRMVDQFKIGGFVSDSYFIDIGVPEDYVRAQKELPEKWIGGAPPVFEVINTDENP
jgi:D-glycero-alpha-D-manno-heptose 1-phosphate guanylyltransferase